MKYKNLIFDFDGVLAESNEVRFNGFRQLFAEFPQHQVDKLIVYVRANGGISRYEKIQYFFNEVLGESIAAERVQSLAEQFSGFVQQKVIDAKPVKGSLEFLTQNVSSFNFALVSGSDQSELIKVCRARGINNFFKEILGSPVDKKENLAQLLKNLKWKASETVYVGDSRNDLEAARANFIDFIGRNSGLVDWGFMGIPSVPDFLSLKETLDLQQ
jgi:phosphoglycolate phosphatase-like HAD superfamily hydrolase